MHGTGGAKFQIPHRSANLLRVLKIAHDMVIGKVIPFSVCIILNINKTTDKKSEQKPYIRILAIIVFTRFDFQNQ